MKLKSMIAACAAGVALASPWAANAYEYNDGTYKWRFWLNTSDDETDVTGVDIREVKRVDGGKFSGNVTFPAFVTLTVTNELGYSEYNEATEKSNWVSTRPMKVETLTLPVEGIDFSGFLYEKKDGEYTWTAEQTEPLITSITIPEGVEYVYGLVGECLTNVTSVTFPSTVESISSCFGFCDKLANVTIPQNVWVDSAFIGTAWAKSMGDFFKIGKNLVRYQGQGGDVTVPDGVTSIGTAAFAPYYWEGFDEASWDMFAAATNITSVTLPNSVERIGRSAFSGCTKLAQVSLPKTVNSIDSYAFQGCKALQQISLDRVIQIDYGAFQSSGLTSIALPATLRYLGSCAFSYTPILSLVIPEGIKSLSWTCYYMTNLTSVTLPESAQYLSCTFYGCEKLASVNIPSNVKRIEYYTFANCKALTSVTGGAGLEYVSQDAFGSRQWVWDSETGTGKYSTTVGVPFYDNAADGFRVLGPVVYGYKGKAPESVTVPAGIKYVSQSAMNDADKSAVKSITLSDGVEAVGYYAFSDCANLETVNLGNTVTNLGSYAFGWCYNLATVTGGAEVERAAYAFSGTKYFSEAVSAAGNEVPFEWIKLGSVAIGYKGKVPAGEFVIPSDMTDLRDMFYYDGSATNATAVVGGESLCGSVSLAGFTNAKRIDLTGPITEFNMWSAYALEEINLRNAELEYLESDMFQECSTNVTKVVVGVGEDFCELYSATFRYCKQLASVELLRKGYRAIGYRGYTGDLNELFPNDVSTFKYIGCRYDWDPENVGWCWDSFELYPVWQAVVVDAQSIEAFDKAVKSSYAGMLYDADGEFAGTFEVTVNKASATKDGSATVKIVPIDGKKESIRGTVDASGNGQGGLAGLKFGSNGVVGKLTAVKNEATFDVVGVTDASKAKTGSAEAEFLKAFKNMAWGVSASPSEVASDFSNGSAAFSIVMAAKGKAKVTGVLPNGTKVSVTTKMIVGDEKCAIPVSFAKQNDSFGFVLWVDLKGKVLEVTDMTDWMGLDGTRTPFVQTWFGEAMGDALVDAVDPIVRIWAADLPDTLTNNVQEAFLPTYEEFTAVDGKWTFAKAPRIKYTKGAFDQETYDADVAKGKTNNSGVKLTLTKKSGAFKGTFTIYCLDGNGKLKKNKATVNGVMIDGIGYGSALIKKFGSVPVMIGHPGLGVDSTSY